MVNEMLPYLNQKGLELLENEFDTFVKILADKGQATDALWYDFVKILFFKKEAKHVKAYLEKPNNLTEHKQQILDFLKSHPCQFDLDTVKAFKKELKDGKKVDFEDFFKTDSLKHEEHWQKMFESACDM